MAILEEVIRRYESMDAKRASWLTLWEEVASYVLPHKGDFTTIRIKGDKSRTVHIYDSTAIHANHLLASHIHGAVTNPASVWFEMRFRETELNDDKDASQWLDDCRRRMLNAFSDSSFDTQVNELYQDLTCFGTGCMYVDWVEGLNFMTCHMSGVAIDEDYSGRVDTVFLERRMTARQIAQRWPDASIPRVKRDLEQDPDRTHRILHGVTPAGEVNYKSAIPEQPWKSCWVAVDDKEILEEGGYFEKPYLTPRWSKISNDVYGFSPALMARPDIRTLNEAKRYELAAWEKTIDPPMMASATGVVSDLHMEAGAVTYVRDMNSIAPLFNRTDWNAAQIKAQEIRDSIRAIYHIDQLHIPERPNATATEVQIRYELMQRVLGPTMGRLQSEFLNPLIERVFGLMYRNGQFTPPPEVLAGYNTDLDIEYQGPLARSQKLSDIQSIQRAVEIGMTLGQLDPSVANVMDMDKAFRIALDRIGIPSEAVRSPKEVEEIRQQQAEAAQQQAQMEAQQGG